MSMSPLSQIIVFVTAFLGAAYIWVFSVPFVVAAIFTVLCLMWAAWVFISVFRGIDELQSAGVRHALAAASGIGLPLAIAAVMVMVAMPDLQRVITAMAASSNSGLAPAAVGFALGVSFTFMVLCAVFAVSHSVWWVSKR